MSCSTTSYNNRPLRSAPVGCPFSSLVNLAHFFSFYSFLSSYACVCSVFIHTWRAMCCCLPVYSFVIRACDSSALLLLLLHKRINKRTREWATSLVISNCSSVKGEESNGHIWLPTATRYIPLPHEFPPLPCICNDVAHSTEFLFVWRIHCATTAADCWILVSTILRFNILYLVPSVRCYCSRSQKWCV